MKPAVLLSLSLFALPAFATGAEMAKAEQEFQGCLETNESCRETCSLEYGTDLTRRSALGTCFNRCDSDLKVCGRRVTQASKTAPVPAPKETPVAPRQKAATASAQKDPVPELVVKPAASAPAPTPAPKPVRVTDSAPGTGNN